MKKYITLIPLLLLAATVNAGTVVLPYTNHMNSASGITGTAYSSPAPDFIADATSPDASMSYRWTFPAGYSGANSPAIMGVSFTGQNEIYVQYYFKYSANWTWSGIGQKHIYIWMGSTGGYNFYTGTGMWDSSSPSFYVNFQAPGGSGTIQASTNINTQKDRWYKVVLRCVVNTGSNSDGTIQVWMDDVLILNRSNIRFKNPGAAFTKLDFTPVWGGDFNVPATSYLYFDYLRIQTTAFGGGGGDTTPSQFTFTDVTGAGTSTLYTSNSITVAGIDTETSISISDGEYEKNGSGTWTSSTGTVNNSDTVKVRQTSSGSYTTSTSTMLNIGGVTDTYTVTTVPPTPSSIRIHIIRP